VLHVDPKAGRVEIVTGPDAAARLDDHSCRLASTEMAAMCAAGDIVGGVVTGLRMLGDAVFWSSADRATATGTT
jgi:hypothetical protein